MPAMTTLFKHKSGNFHVREDTLDEYVVKEVAYYNKHLRITAGDVILDAGGNIGAFAVMAAKKGAIVHTFEPEQENYALLLANLEQNGCAGVVHAYNEAIMEASGTVKFYINTKKNKGAHSTTARRGRECVEVPARAWSDLGFAYNKAKIDIEGAEYNLIENCLSEIAHIEAGVIEMHINGFGVDRYLAAVETLEGRFPRGTYDKNPMKKWHTYATI